MNTLAVTSTTTTTTITTTPTPEGWQHGSMDEARIRELMVVSYWVLIPVVVAVGVVINALGLYLLSRPRMRSLPATAYFKLLLSLDVGILLVSITTIITLNGCHIHSSGVARYFAHPSFTVFYMLQTFGHYVIVWVCYDRFLALWCFTRFQRTQKPSVVKFRIICTGLLCILVNLRHLLDVEVMCVSDAEVVEATNHTKDCEGGAWIILDSLHQRERREMWQMVVWVARGLLTIVIPVLLVLALNSGIVIGLVRRRLHSAASTTRTRDQAYSSIYISLAISFTSVTSAMPTVIHALLFATNIKYCHGPFREEVFRVIANLLLLGEHLTHMLFLAFNQTFREETRTLLHNTKSFLCNTIAWVAQTGCPSRPPTPATHNTHVVANAHVSIRESSQIPHLVVSTLEDEKNVGSSVEIVTPTQASLTTFLTEAGLGGEGSVSEPEHSARTSVMTLEEENT